MHRRQGNERGAVAVVVALSALAMFVIGALVVDLGLARDVRGQSQASADSAALAGGNVLYPVGRTCTTPGAEAKSPCFTDAVKAAKAYAQRNFNIPGTEWNLGSNGCVLPSGYLVPTTIPSGERTTCITFDHATKPEHIRVQMPNSDVNTGLGTLAGVSKITVAGEADAIIKAATQGKCALCFLSGVSVGNGDFDISGSSVHVNGDLAIGSQSYWKAGAIYVAGSWSPSDEAHITPDPTVAEPITDPFADDPRFPPSLAGLSNKTGSPCGAGKGPGIYGDFSWGNNDVCNLDPGLYVVTGTWTLGNNTVFAGNGVTIYVPNPGILDLKNSGAVSLTAPTAAQVAATGGIEGFAIVYGRDNPNILSLQGNGTTTNDGSGCSSSGTPSIVGGIYAANGKLSVNGTSCLAVDKGPIVVGGVDPNMNFTGNKSGLRLSNGAEVTLDNMPKDVALYQ